MYIKFYDFESSYLFVFTNVSVIFYFFCPSIVLFFSAWPTQSNIIIRAPL